VTTSDSGNHTTERIPPGEKDSVGDFFDPDSEHTQFVPEQVIATLLKRENDSEKYIVDCKVAQGGMGAIYRVDDQDLKRTSVLKIILPGVMEDALLFRRFIEEAQITAQLEHPNIIPVHELGVLGDDKLYFSMKYVQGDPLGSILKKVRDGDKEFCAKYTRFSLLTIFRKVCDAIAYAHSKDIIHRDIKPDNIMVGDYGEVLLMDWGLARREDPDKDTSARHAGGDRHEYYEDEAEDDGFKTQFGVVKGTPAYMAPEQARGSVDEIDNRSDIYLLGTTLYAMVTFQVPFVGNDIYEILANAENGIFVPPGERAPEREIPEELCRIIMKAMAFKQEDRYQTVEALSEDLDALMAGNTGSTRKRFRAGEYIMQEGEAGNEAYVILSGKVEVSKTVRGKSITLISLTSGDIIGEMALILQAPRTATVQAIENTKVVVINEDTMKQGLGQLPPWMGKVVDSLADRLRTANANVHPLMSGNCTYHVLNQLRLIYAFWSVPEIDENNNGTVAVVNTDHAVHEIASNLSITKERVALILSQLFEHNLVTPVNSDAFYISNFGVLCQLVDHARQQMGIETGFDQNKSTSLYADKGELVVRHSVPDGFKSASEPTEILSRPADELIGAGTEAEILEQFDAILTSVRESLEEDVSGPGD
jgi:eukaryotic-like serine/threonine-protein kinase